MGADFVKHWKVQVAAAAEATLGRLQQLYDAARQPGGAPMTGSDMAQLVSLTLRKLRDEQRAAKGLSGPLVWGEGDFSAFFGRIRCSANATAAHTEVMAAGAEYVAQWRAWVAASKTG